MATLYDFLSDVDAWNGDCIHVWRFPTHTPSPCDRSSADKSDTGTPAFLEKAVSVYQGGQ